MPMQQKGKVYAAKYLYVHKINASQQNTYILENYSYSIWSKFCAIWNLRQFFLLPHKLLYHIWDKWPSWTSFEKAFLFKLV